MDTLERQPSDNGGAYGWPRQHHDALLTEVGPGTPCGEFMRRYWQPVALSTDATVRPRQIRILGEDLILFRDRKGRPGLLYPRCAHRGTTLFYGRVEDEGIRCCYHGWLFGVDGKCLDQPCEPNGGEHRDQVRQPWYPVQEMYGLVWAYMGPPAKKPVLTRWHTLENLGPDEEIRTRGDGNGAGGDDVEIVIPCNWLQDWENIMDPFHVPILHTTFSGVQFVPEMAIMPDVTWDYADHGMKYIAYRKLDDGKEMDRVTQALFPHVRIVPNTSLNEGAAAGVGWVVPVDDTHFRLFHASRSLKSAPRARGGRNGKKHSERTELERQDEPGDYEAQVGQGPISYHSEENLAQSDQGVVRLRRFLAEQIKVVQAGGDPAGVTFDPAKAVMQVQAGNWYR